ncbi:MAG: lipocalin-like domain-containing protein [Pseudomonadota bacterium]
MSARRLLAALALLLAPLPAAAQGYAGLGSEAGDYAPVTPGRAVAFPADHAPHPRHRIEWWYVTANLETPSGRPLGAQWTLFRQAVAPDGPASGWHAPQVWMAHAAVTTADRHLSAEKFARGGVGQAGAEIGPFRAWIDDWRLASLSAPFSPLRLQAAGDAFAYDLRLQAQGPLVLQGDDGYSRKSEGAQASYYYSQPFFTVSGEVRLGDETLDVTGRAWLDREWSSQPLEPDQEGWDWFSLHLPGGEKLMLYRMRRKDGDHHHASSWIGPDGAVQTLGDGDVEMHPLETAQVAGREVPVAWEIAVPAKSMRIRTHPLNPRSWMDMAFPYWEGPVRFSGTHDGVGYLEMTGY